MMLNCAAGALARPPRCSKPKAAARGATPPCAARRIGAPSPLALLAAGGHHAGCHDEHCTAFDADHCTILNRDDCTAFNKDHQAAFNRDHQTAFNRDHQTACQRPPARRRSGEPHKSLPYEEVLFAALRPAPASASVAAFTAELVQFVSGGDAASHPLKGAGTRILRSVHAFEGQPLGSADFGFGADGPSVIASRCALPWRGSFDAPPPPEGPFASLHSLQVVIRDAAGVIGKIFFVSLPAAHGGAALIRQKHHYCNSLDDAAPPITIIQHGIQFVLQSAPHLAPPGRRLAGQVRLVFSFNQSATIDRKSVCPAPSAPQSAGAMMSERLRIVTEVHTLDDGCRSEPAATERSDRRAGSSARRRRRPAHEHGQII